MHLLIERVQHTLCNNIRIQVVRYQCRINNILIHVIRYVYYLSDTIRPSSLTEVSIHKFFVRGQNPALSPSNRNKCCTLWPLHTFDQSTKYSLVENKIAVPIDDRQLKTLQDRFNIVNSSIRQIDTLNAPKDGTDHKHSLLDCKKELRPYYH